MLKFIQTHGVGSDETAPYDVVLDKPYTVSEFINEVLTTRKSEWGDIEVKGAFFLKYRYGKAEQEIPEQYAKLPVKKAHASGGWSAMNYKLDVGLQGFLSDMDEKDVSPFEPDREKGKHETAKEIDWEQRRYEIAKECLVQRIDRKIEKMDILIQFIEESDVKKVANLMNKEFVKSCVSYADELIKELKGEK